MARTASGFACLLCGTAFSRHNSITRHFRDKHVDEGVDYVCPVPGCSTKPYSNRRYFEGHLSRSHPELKGLEAHKCAVHKTREDQ